MALDARLAALITAFGTDWKNIWANTGLKANLSSTDKTNLVAAINEARALAVSAAGGGVSINDSTPSGTTTYSSTKIEALNAVQDTVISGKANTSHTHTLSQITDAASKADASAVVLLTGAQTVAGIKTFSSAPVVPDASFTIAKTSGLQAALDAKAVMLDTALGTDATKVWSAQKTTTEINARATALIGGASAAFDTFQELQALMQADDTETAGIITSLGLRVRVDASQSFTSPQMLQGRTNIGAQSAADIGNPDVDLVALYTAAKA